MRRLYLAAGILVFAVSTWVAVESRTNLNYYTQYGPGPGFFPFWLGSLLGVLSLVWLGQVALQPAEPMPRGFIPERARAIRMVSVVAAIAVFALLAETLGFQLAMFAFLLYVQLAQDRRRPALSVLLALLGSWALAYFFRNMLEVQLPLSHIEFLRDLGL